jgi:uncharacterized membrane-anchored protein
MEHPTYILIVFILAGVFAGTIIATMFVFAYRERTKVIERAGLDQNAALYRIAAALTRMERP